MELKLRKQLRKVVADLHDRGMTYQEIGEIFGRSYVWAWDVLHNVEKMSKIIINERLVNGLRTLGYDVRLVKIRETGGEGNG